jgi:hypothetical protein
MRWGQQGRVAAPGRRGSALAVAAFGVLATACVPIEQQVVLAVSPGSEIVLRANPNLPGIPPLTTQLEGSIDSTLTLEIGLFDFLFGRPFEGTIEVGDIVIAGTPIDVLGISTGHVCTLLDPNEPSGGDATIDLGQGELEFTTTAGATLYTTDPIFLAVTGLYDGVDVPVSVQGSAPVNLFDLLAALSGEVLPISFCQELSFPLPPQVVFFQNGSASGTVCFESVAAPPTSPALEFCAGYQP